MLFTQTRYYKAHKSGFSPVRLPVQPKAATPAYDLGAYGDTLAAGLLNATSGIPALVVAALPVFGLLVGIAMLPRVAKKFGIKR